ncbi:MAG: hypothetical protein H8D67_17365 [Deltaproteobacteria bacterium]|nr:hypothetical protein [Deltaproteobacteria bacterium]
MADVIKIPVRPGGMLSDVVKTELGGHQHQEVKNLRQNKSGLWECVPGYIDYFEDGSYNNIKAAVEIFDEYSGDRFILFQHGTGLYRLDYDDGDGNGYENETPTALSLPSGVTIGGSAVLRFFYFRGVVRITGASVPLWYGYVDRTLFENGEERIDQDTFEASTESWTGSDATVAQSVVQAFMNTNSLIITQTNTDGKGKKTFTIVSGEHYRFTLFLYKDTVGGAGSVVVNLGSSDGASDYYTVTVSTKDEWVKVQYEFDATGTSLFVEVNAGSGQNADVCYIDMVELVREEVSIVIANWILTKCELTNLIDSSAIDVVTQEDIFATASGHYKLYLQSFIVFDDGQYSLMKKPTLAGSAVLGPFKGGNFQHVRLQIKIPGSSLETAFPNKRITAIGICAAIYTVGSGKAIDEDSEPFYKQEIIPINEVVLGDKIQFARNNYYYDGTNNFRLQTNFGASYNSDQVHYDGCFAPGAVVEFRNSFANVTTTVIGVSNSSTNLTIYFEDDISSLKSGGGAGTLPETTVIIYRKWRYDSSNGYSIFIGIDVENLGANEFYNFVDIPSGTEDINPDYSHHVVIEDRAYVNSGEDEEEDTVRYSSLEMFDCFPNGNLIQTEVGDVDQIKAIVKRGSRLVMLKRNSFSQGNFVGGSYYEDIGIKQQGLFGDLLYIVIDDVLYFGDEQDVFAWNGVQAVPLLNTLKMKEFYKSYVDTNSLILYNKLNNELWFVLKGGASDQVMVFDIDRGDWYLRDTDETLLGGFINYVNQMICFSAGKFVQFDHALSTFDESVNWSFTTKVFGFRSPRDYKKLKEIQVVAKSGVNITVVGSDETQALGYSDEIMPSATAMVDKYLVPSYLFRQLELVFAGKAASATMSLELRELFLLVSRWK